MVSSVWHWRLDSSRVRKSLENSCASCWISGSRPSFMIKSLGSRALKANSCCQNRLNWDNFFLDLCYSKTSPICGPNYKRSMIISYDADWKNIYKVTTLALQIKIGYCSQFFLHKTNRHRSYFLCENCIRAKRIWRLPILLFGSKFGPLNVWLLCSSGSFLGSHL